MSTLSSSFAFSLWLFGEVFLYRSQNSLTWLHLSCAYNFLSGFNSQQKMYLWTHRTHSSTHRHIQPLTPWRWSRWFLTEVQPLKVREPENWIGLEIFIHLILNIIYLMIHPVIIVAFAERVAPSNWLGSPWLYSTSWWKWITAEHSA